jgi:hypothetical protein
VAHRLRFLLDHPADRDRLSEAGLSFARDNQFAALAETLVSLVTS